MSREDFDAGTFARFRTGLFLLAEGAAFLRAERRLWPLAFVPVLFATILVGFAVSFFWIRLELIHEIWTSALPIFEAGRWWTWIWIGPGKFAVWLVGWIGVVLAFALSVIAALLFANLVSAPFLDQLSQRVEAIEQGSPFRSGDGFIAGFRDTLRSFVAELQRVVFLAGVWILLSLAGFIVPGAHLVTGPLLVATTVLLLPLDYAGFALDRRGVSFRSRRRWLWSNLPTTIGFGGVAFVACLVPGVNLLIMPALVTAGTLLVMRASPSEAD